jgi:hypothetical protein
MSASVSTITPHVRRVEAPSDLRELPGWLCWRNEQVPGEEKPRKVPYYASGQRRHGKQGAPDDRAKLVAFAAARDAASRMGMDGVGLAMLPDFGVTALDFDYCVDADGRLPTEVESIVSQTYAEYSPSGKGVRAFVKGQLGNQKSHRDAANSYGFEVFSSSGYVTFTGNTLPFTEALGLEDLVAPMNDEVVSLFRQRFGDGATSQRDAPGADPFETFEPALGLTLDEARAYLSDLDPNMGREPWMQVAMALHHEFGADGFELWNDWSQGGVRYPGTHALSQQWLSLDRRQPAGRPITMRTVKKMSAEARREAGLEPRSLIETRAEATDTDPGRMSSSDDWKGKYRVYTGLEFSQRPPIDWMIKGVLPDNADLVMMYGASGSGKSFVVLDMVMSLVRGVDWRGRRTKRKRALYIAAEGGGGVSQRLRAYSLHHGVKLDNLPLGIIHDAPNLMVEEDVSALVKAILDAGGADLIVIDTLAQVTPGANENSAEDMGLALKHARALRRATGAVILLVAHTGKDQAKGIRGWSGLHAATDTAIEVVKPESEDEDDARLIRIAKQKDGRDDLSWGFRFETVVVAFDSDNEEVTSLVVVEADPPTRTPSGQPRKLGAWEEAVMDYIASLGLSFSGLSMSDLLDGVRDSIPAPAPGERDVRRQNAMRAVRSLCKGHDAPLILENGFVTLGAFPS